MNQTSLEEQKLTVSEPEFSDSFMYVIFMLYDAETPMPFKVEVLEQFFDMSREKAIDIILDLEELKKKVRCGTYTKNIAETKIKEIQKYIKDQGHSLILEIYPTRTTL